MPGNRKRMRLDGNLGLIEMTEENGIYAEVSTQDEFVHLSGGMKTVYSFHYYASILTLRSWFHLRVCLPHKEKNDLMLSTIATIF